MPPIHRGRSSLVPESHPRSPSTSSHHHHERFGGLKKVLTGASISKKSRKGSKSSKAGSISHQPAHARDRNLAFPIHEHDYDQRNHHGYSTGQHEAYDGTQVKAEPGHFFNVFLSLMRWKKKLLLKAHKGKHHETETLMACPFFRLDPSRFHRCVGKYELRRFSDVKQHLERCHSLGGYSCANCQANWPKQDGLRDHLRNGCSSAAPVAPDRDKIPPEKLECLKKMPRGASDATKYQIMWKAFFPGPCPDPFLKDYPTEAASQLRKFQETSLRRIVIPELLQKHGVVLGNRQKDLIEDLVAEAFNTRHAQPPAPIYRQGSAGLASSSTSSPPLEGAGVFTGDRRPSQQLLTQSPEQLQQPFPGARVKPELPPLQCDLASLQSHPQLQQHLAEPISAASLVCSPAVSIGDGFQHGHAGNGDGTLHSTRGYNHFSQQRNDSYLSPTVSQHMGSFPQPSQDYSQDTVAPSTMNLTILGGPSGPPSLISENGGHHFNDWSLYVENGNGALDDLDAGPSPSSMVHPDAGPDMMKLDDADFSNSMATHDFNMALANSGPDIMVYGPNYQQPPVPDVSFPKDRCLSCMVHNTDLTFCVCQSPAPGSQIM